MLILEDIPDDAVSMKITGENGYGGEYTITADEDIIARMRRETNEERIKRYCRVIEQLVDDI